MGALDNVLEQLKRSRGMQREREEAGVGRWVLGASWADLNRHRTKGQWKEKYEEGEELWEMEWKKKECSEFDPFLGGTGRADRLSAHASVTDGVIAAHSGFFENLSLKWVNLQNPEKIRLKRFAVTLLAVPKLKY
ncbi:hypothetical protein NQZ68_026624 [Dissostichus eleginoides]|nr:hypothetical protein NQZ68_026624 [Dissostichus eleginoides]